MKILVISVHPDDETLGCGGTILKHLENNDEIYWMIITRADTSVGFSKEFINEREKQINLVSKMYNFKKVFKLGFLATKLHMVDFTEVVTNISLIITEVKPDIVYMNNRTDVHTDHQIAAKAIISATKSFRYPFIKKILMYECISETEMAPAFAENVFIPNVYSDITKYISEKCNIMKVYKSEVQEIPLPRSIENMEALATYRGASCGCNYAEAFMLVREKF